MKVFIVGKLCYFAWDFIGVFYDEKKAIAACRTVDHFIGPTELDKDFGDDPIVWEGLYFPLRDKESP